MTRLIMKLFIKNSEDVKDEKVRQRYGIVGGVVGIICNIILFAAKFFAGIITSSVSISADAFNNLSDAGSSIVTLVGFKMAFKPADSEHPFGHGRIEYLAGLTVAVAIILMGFELFKSSITKIITPEAVEFSMISVIILIASILVKFWMSAFNKKLGKKIDSPAMLATAADSLSDCIATATVLLALIICKVTGVNVDGIAGAIVAIFVFKAGIEAAGDTLAPLLGQAPKEEFVEAIEKKVMSHKEIVGIHDMIVHDYGPTRVYVTLHAEIPRVMDVCEAHDCIDLIEQEIKKEFGCGITIHMDPIATDDPVVMQLKEMVINIVHDIDNTLMIHDFRITEGPYLKNLIFDVVVPQEFRYSDDEVKKMIQDKVSAVNDTYHTVIEVDKCYIQAPSNTTT